MWFQKIKDYYDKKLWNLEMVKNAVVKGKITPEQYKEITGDVCQLPSTKVDGVRADNPYE